MNETIVANTPLAIITLVGCSEAPDVGTAGLAMQAEIEEPGGVEVSPGQDLITTWVTQDWLAGVDVGACIADGDIPMTDGTVVVDDETTEGTCSDIENVIKDNMKKSGQLGGA
ncbi:MAG TPA: hypothetical protein ENK57_15445 [Polyangiaceae bacterium]|nr:hypothetical protein [Polyangiaceae bacterium]